MKHSLVLIYACISLLLLFHSSLSCQLIHQTCTRIADNDPNVSYNLCVMSLESNPMSANANLEELGVIAVELALSNATYINWYISNKLLQEKGFDPYAKACLKDCHELYSDAIPELKDVLDDFKDKDYYKANIELSAAMEASTTCEDGYKERKGEVSPLAKEDTNFFQLCAIALAFTNMLH